MVPVTTKPQKLPQKGTIKKRPAATGLLSYFLSFPFALPFPFFSSTFTTTAVNGSSFS